MESLLQTTSDIARKKPEATFDHLCDLTLVVEDGKEFKAHRQALSEASPFFEKLLNSNMKESKESVVRLEMLTESALRDILEFIYTGCVQQLAEDNAQDLVEMADYLLLPQLKTLAGRVLLQTLNASNCISTYYFVERHHCQELVSTTKTFILANFTMVAKTDDFLNLSNKEVEMLISSDDVNVSAEEDVFKIILSWIMQDKKERKKYFAQLFGQVRLVYVPRDYLRREIVTNEFVKNNACLDLVKDAIKLIDSKSIDNLTVTPRKSLETPLIVVCVDKHILCYFPREDKWCRFRDAKPPSSKIFSFHGQLYFINQTHCKLTRYNSLSNRWTTLPYKEKRVLQQVFASNEDGIYALVTDDRLSCRGCVALRSRGIRHEGPVDVLGNPLCGRKHLTSITRYKPESNSWEDISSLDLGLRDGICIVAKDKFVYFIGGRIRGTNKILTDVDRYDLSKDKWDKVADVQEARKCAYGAAAHGKIFITDDGKYNLEDFTFKRTCEVYNEATNEWQFIASLRIQRSRHGSMMLLMANCMYWTIIWTV